MQVGDIWEWRADWNPRLMERFLVVHHKGRDLYDVMLLATTDSAAIPKLGQILHDYTWEDSLCWKKLA